MLTLHVRASITRNYYVFIRKYIIYSRGRCTRERLDANPRHKSVERSINFLCQPTHVRREIRYAVVDHTPRVSREKFFIVHFRHLINITNANLEKEREREIGTIVFPRFLPRAILGARSCS